MRVGLNFLRLDPSYKGGVNSFAFGLADGFAASRRGHEFVIFAGAHNIHMFAPYEALPNFRVMHVNEVNPSFWAGPVRRLVREGFLRLPWTIRYRIPQLHFNKWLNAPYARQMEKAADVLFTPYVAPPLFPFPNIPAIYSIHDLQHVHFPQFFNEEMKLERKANFAATEWHAAMIQATTRQMRDEFLDYYPLLTPERVVIIPEGVNVDAYTNEDGREDVRLRYRLPEKFIFYPAQFWPHKDHITILKALSRLKQQGIIISLVLTGAKSPLTESLLEFAAQDGLDGQVYYLGVVPYEDVIALHRAARFLVTTSLYEAGSIPMLEAAAAGTAIIGSGIPSHTEHSEELQMQLFPPSDDAALAALLHKSWGDDDLIARQVAYNRQAIRKFTWNSAAERYLDAFEALMAKKR
jgi:glycosyltransferase involved in cell wall biosynthesis